MLEEGFHRRKVIPAICPWKVLSVRLLSKKFQLTVTKMYRDLNYVRRIPPLKHLGVPVGPVSFVPGSPIKAHKSGWPPTPGPVVSPL
jgi:hypothetical protein